MAQAGLASGIMPPPGLDPCVQEFLSWFRLSWHAVGWVLLFLDFLWCVLPLRRFLDWVLDSWRFMGCVTSLSCAMQSTNDGFLERSTLKIVMEAMGDFEGIAMGTPRSSTSQSQWAADER